MPSLRDAFRMALPPALIALAVTLLRLAGELRGWSEAWFSRATSGLVPEGAVSWTPLLGGLHGTRMRRDVVAALLACGLVPVASAETPDALAAKVRAREVAFAKTMADRDHATFRTFVAEEALFMGRQTVLRGRAAVAQGWKPYFEGEKAPFSWAPERVEVVDSGTLALSTGPVFDPDGKRTGTYNSTWRLEKDGEWWIVLDNGCPPCRCP